MVASRRFNEDEAVNYILETLQRHKVPVYEITHTVIEKIINFFGTEVGEDTCDFIAKEFINLRSADAYSDPVLDLLSETYAGDFQKQVKAIIKLKDLHNKEMLQLLKDQM